jgi:hypothetical protein
VICEKLLTNLEWDWDFYQVIPPGMETERIPNHPLLLRRNKETGRFEVRRHFYTRRIVRLKGVIVETCEDLQVEEIAFEGDLEGAVKFTNSEMVRYGSIETFGERELLVRAHIAPPEDSNYDGRTKRPTTRI